MLNVRDMTHVVWAANVKESQQSSIAGHMPLQRWLDLAAPQLVPVVRPS